MMPRMNIERSYRHPARAPLSALLMIPPVLIALILLIGAGSPPGDATPEEKGKRIYTSGTGSSTKPIVAVLSGAEVPASVLPCKSCHGEDGKGRPEGGIRPANITADALAAEFRDERSAAGRKRPPYDERKLKRAIAMGIDAGGNELHSAMPRYRMTAEDMANLIAYLKVLGKEHETGLTDSTIEVGTPPATRDAAGGAALAAVRAYFDQVNSDGGIYNRSLSLAPAAEAFALLGSDDDAKAADESNIPTVDVAVGSRTEPARGGAAFYLLPGLSREGWGLVNYAREAFPGGGLVIVHPPGERWGRLAAAMIDDGRKPDGAPAFAISSGDDPARLNALLAREHPSAIVLLDPSPMARELLAGIARGEHPPAVLMPGSFMETGRIDIPETLKGGIYLSYPSWLSSVSRRGMEEYGRLRERYGLSREHLRSQLVALAGARVLVEGLRRSGRDLSREVLIAQLQRLYEFGTGLIPPVTYGPNRRVGSDSVYIVSFDAARKGSAVVAGYRSPATMGTEQP